MKASRWLTPGKVTWKQTVTFIRSGSDIPSSPVQGGSELLFGAGKSPRRCWTQAELLEGGWWPWGAKPSCWKESSWQLGGRKLLSFETWSVSDCRGLITQLSQVFLLHPLKCLVEERGDEPSCRKSGVLSWLGGRLRSNRESLWPKYVQLPTCLGCDLGLLGFSAVWIEADKSAWIGPKT